MALPAYVDSTIFKFDLGQRIAGGDPIITMGNRPTVIGNRVTKTQLRDYVLSLDPTIYNTGRQSNALPVHIDDLTGDAIRHGVADERISCVVVAGGSAEAAVDFSAAVYDIAATTAEGQPETVACKFGSNDFHIVVYSGADPDPTSEIAAGYLVCSATACETDIPSSDAIALARGCKVIAVDTTLKLAVIRLRG